MLKYTPPKVVLVLDFINMEKYGINVVELW